MTAVDDRLAALDSALVRIQQVRDETTVSHDDLSYDLQFDLAGYWDETVARFRTLVEQLTYFASAKSNEASGAQARGAISWTGDLSTVWSGHVLSGQPTALFDLLEANSRYRARLLLVVISAVQTAGMLCAASSPFMLPAAYRSLSHLVVELRELARLSNLE